MLKTQGRRGEVAAELHTDFPERFAQRKRLFALDESGARRELQLEEFWAHKGGMVLKFAGVDSISEAEKLVGCEIQVPAEERAPLEPGAFYVSDLVGCELIALSQRGNEQAAHPVGKVAEVQFGAGEAPLLVIRESGREFLVPWVEEFVKGVDLEHKRLTLALPEGMLELDAPLTEEEKREQRERGTQKK